MSKKTLDIVGFDELNRTAAKEGEVDTILGSVKALGMFETGESVWRGRRGRRRLALILKGKTRNRRNTKTI